jgi:integrase
MPTFRPLVRAALETGCRYGELTRLEVQDFDPDAGTVAILQSKSGKPRHVVLTEVGADFFRQHCAGRVGNELMLRRADGSAWKKSDQGAPMLAACAHARITPAISFHILRHTWASLAVMAGVPLMVVARNLGHVEHENGRKALRPFDRGLHYRRHPGRRTGLRYRGRQGGCAAAGALVISRVGLPSHRFVC